MNKKYHFIFDYNVYVSIFVIILPLDTEMNIQPSVYRDITWAICLHTDKTRKSAHLTTAEHPSNFVFKVIMLSVETLGYFLQPTTFPDQFSLFAAVLSQSTHITDRQTDDIL